MKQLLSNKVGVIMGVANNVSIAWGIAKSCYTHGARFTITYQSKILEKRVKPLVDELGSCQLVKCDVAIQESIDQAFNVIKDQYGKIDFLVHAIAFADKNELRGRYVDTSKSNFLNTLDVSCYSFVYTAKKAAEILNAGGSILTLTYYGAEKVIPNYNVMGVAKAALESSVRYIASDLGELGIRVNAVSAGPIKTLAASGIGDFRTMLKFSEKNAPLKRNVTIDEVGNVAMYLISDLSSGITGEIIYIDSGYNIMGAPKIIDQ